MRNNYGASEIGKNLTEKLASLNESMTGSIGIYLRTSLFHNNCSQYRSQTTVTCLTPFPAALYQLIVGECGCNFSHPEKADCKQNSIEQIPPIFKQSITSMNLDRNIISHIDAETINLYTRLKILSLRRNKLAELQDFTFINLTSVKRL